MLSLNTSSTSIALLSAIYLYVYAALTLPAGLLVDAIGIRRIVATGASLMAVGPALMSLANNTAELFAGQGILAAGGSLAVIAGLKGNAIWFPPNKFTTLSSLSASASGAGALLATAPLAIVVVLIGWRGAFAVSSAACLCIAALAMLILDDGPLSKTKRSAIGLRAARKGLRQVLRSRRTWPLLGTAFFLYAAAANLTLWIVPFFRDVYGLESRHAAFLAMTPALTTLISAPIVGWMSESVFKRYRLPYVALTGACCALWIVFVVFLGMIPISGACIVLAALGIANGGYVLVWPLVRSAHPDELVGIAVAAVNLAALVGAAASQPPLGALLDTLWAGDVSGATRAYPLAAYQAVFSVCAVCTLCATAAAFCIREN